MYKVRSTSFYENFGSEKYQDIRLILVLEFENLRELDIWVENLYDIEEDINSLVIRLASRISERPFPIGRLQSFGKLLYKYRDSKGLTLGYPYDPYSTPRKENKVQLNMSSMILFRF